MMPLRTYRRVTLVALVMLLQPLEAGQFEPPDMDGFSLHGERDADGDGDDINETHIKQYLNSNGDSAYSMTTNGKLWAWSLDTRDDDSGPYNYVIRDSNCDGNFDEVYGLTEEYHVPDCVKKSPDKD
jgi:hypothetical protein